MALGQEPSDALAITARVVSTFERLGVAYAIVGSLASSLYGQPRSTNDADVVADLSAGVVDGFVADLGAEFYLDSEAIRRAVDRSSHFNVIHLATMFKIDVFVVGREPASRDQLQRAVRISVASHDLLVGSLEDTIVRKLRWYRDGNEVSQRQWLDVLGMLRLQAGRVDTDLLDRLARELQVSDLLLQAQTVAQQTPGF